MSFAVWTLLFSVALIVYALASLFATDKVRAALVALPRCNAVAWVTVPVAWAWTAYECDIIGIDVFDKYLKAFPGELWILAIVLTVLTIWWMPNLLPLRGICGLFMLVPARFFAVARLIESDWRCIVVSFVNVLAVLGMWGMFYPWHYRRLLAWRAESPARVKAFGWAFLVFGVVFAVLSFVL